MIRKAVDLPQPDGPSSERNSPRRSPRPRRSGATVPLPKVLLTWCRATTGVVGAVVFIPALYPSVNRCWRRHDTVDSNCCARTNAKLTFGCNPARCEVGSDGGRHVIARVCRL